MLQILIYGCNVSGAGDTLVRKGLGIANIASEDEGIYETITKCTVLHSFPVLLPR